MISVKIDTHGCKLNQADSIQLYKKFIQNGFNVNSNLENPDIYISGFNWVGNWIDNYFFNKISDTLLGLIFTSIIFHSKI